MSLRAWKPHGGYLPSRRREFEIRDSGERETGRRLGSRDDGKNVVASRSCVKFPDAIQRGGLLFARKG